MVEQHILTTDDRIELLEGWLIAKMSKDRPHVISANRTLALVSALIPAGWYVAKEDSVQGKDSELEPDVSIVKGTFEDYRKRTPGPTDIALVVEVADTSLYRDRTIKNGFTPGPVSPSTGSSTSSITGSKSTPTPPGRSINTTTYSARTLGWTT